MNPLLKKVLAALAIKEGIEKVQEMRNPKPSMGERLGGLLKVGAVGGGLFYLYKSGRLAPVVDKAKGLMGGNEPVSSEHTWTAPTGTNGSTTSGTVGTTV